MCTKSDLKKVDWVIESLSLALGCFKRKGLSFYIIDRLYAIRIKIEKGITLSEKDKAIVNRHLEFSEKYEAIG